jgi:transposase
MRYDLSDDEWSIIRPMLPNSHAAFAGWMTDAFSTVSFGSCTQAHHGAICQTAMVLLRLATTRFARWRRAGVWDRIMDALAAAHDAAVQMIRCITQ